MQKVKNVVIDNKLKHAKQKREILLACSKPAFLQIRHKA